MHAAAPSIIILRSSCWGHWKRPPTDTTSWVGEAAILRMTSEEPSLGQAHTLKARKHIATPPPKGVG